MNVCVRKFVHVRMCVCVCERERESLCVSVCVCVSERERERANNERVMEDRRDRLFITRPFTQLLLRKPLTGDKSNTLSL